MSILPRSLVLAVVLTAACGASALRANDSAHRVFPAGQVPPDSRLAPLRGLRDKDHPWQPPETLAEWEQERERIRTQLLVATGLWPMPEKTPLHPVVHGLVQRDGYTVERVFFASRPGLYVTGSLYRPDGDSTQKHSAVLCPHGHWANGRFYDAGDQGAKKQIETGAESFDSAAHHPLQARMVQLARMGCIVFFYDMIGYADNGPLDHRTGFNDAQAELWSQNIMGLQTWNSIRALDFVCSLPDVDPTRIGVTGASGGGTQTFMLCAIDPRPAVAFPAVMVSTNMQGGCVCENASWLRVGINNVAIAACFAPKPMAMSGADDWTIDIETKGLPELKHVYGLYGKSDLVHAKCFPQFPHNYNQVSRGLMYEWFNQHLGLGATSPIVERDFVPLTREESTVFTAEHPRPADSLTADELRKRMTAESQERSARVTASAELSEYLNERGVPLAWMISPHGEEPTFHETGRSAGEGYTLVKGWCDRGDEGYRVPVVVLTPSGQTKSVVVWIDGNGKQALFDAEGRPIPAVRRLLESGAAVASGDIFLTGEFISSTAGTERKVDETFAGYTFGYNRPLAVERMRDVRLIVGVATRVANPDESLGVALVGTGGAGPVTALTGGFARRTIADLAGFTFGGITSLQDPNLLPGALKFGGLGGLLATADPHPTTLFGCTPDVLRELQPLLERHKGSVETETSPLTPDSVAERLTKSP
jgi:hypothetical protein